MPGEDIKTKVCSKCGKELPLTKEFFAELHTTNDGFKCQCRSCVKAMFERKKKSKYNRAILIAKRNFAQQQGVTQNDWAKFTTWLQKQRQRDWEFYAEDLWRKYWEEELKRRRRQLPEPNCAKTKNFDSRKKLERQVRATIYQSFSRKGYVTPKYWEKIAQVDSLVLVSHLLQTFKLNYGREWDGEEPVEVDHIIPISIAKTEEDIVWLCRYTNLQLLTKADNRAKRNKLNYSIGGIYANSKAGEHELLQQEHHYDNQRTPWYGQDNPRPLLA